MKKLIELGCLGLAAWTLSGCHKMDTVGDHLYDPVVVTNIVSTPTGPYPVVSTNGWTLRPSIENSIALAGDVAPFPWSGLVANAILAVLGIGAHLRGRQWRRAAVSGVSAAQAFKKELKELDTNKAQRVKETVIAEQRNSNTQTLIQKILNSV